MHVRNFESPNALVIENLTFSFAMPEKNIFLVVFYDIDTLLPIQSNWQKTTNN